MGKPKSIIACFFAILLILVSCKEAKQKKEPESNIKIEEKSKTTINTENLSTIVKEDNIFVIDQIFSKENNKNSIEGNPVEVDLAPTSGAMISAYSEYKDEYTVSFKTLENNVWSDWVDFKENEEVKNPKRKVFSPINLKNSVQKIQFKSNKATNSKVIFRIYTFQKQ